MPVYPFALENASPCSKMLRDFHLRVDEEQCVHCHLCEKVCSVILSSPENGRPGKSGDFLEPLAVYAAQY